jgi:hypothetical protein
MGETLPSASRCQQADIRASSSRTVDDDDVLALPRPVDRAIRSGLPAPRLVKEVVAALCEILGRWRRMVPGQGIEGPNDVGGRAGGRTGRRGLGQSTVRPGSTPVLSGAQREESREGRDAHMLTSAPSPVPLPLPSTKTRRRVVVTLASCSSLRSSGWSGPRKRPCEMSLPPDLLVDDDEEKRPMVC